MNAAPRRVGGFTLLEVLVALVVLFFLCETALQIALAASAG